MYVYNGVIKLVGAQQTVHTSGAQFRATAISRTSYEGPSYDISLPGGMIIVDNGQQKRAESRGQA